MTPSARSCAVIAIVAALLGAAPAARAEEDARELTERAQRHFDLGEYAEAIFDFRAAYRLDPRPGLLYNLGQAYRLSGDCVTAALMYRNFLRLDTDSKVRELAEQHLASQEDCARERMAAGERAASDEGTDAVRTGEVPASSVAREEVKVVEPPPPPPPPRQHRYRNAGLVTAAAGAVLAAVGAYFSYDAMRASSQVSEVYRDGGTWSEIERIDARGRRSEVAGGALLSVGTAALAAGVVIAWRF